MAGILRPGMSVGPKRWKGLQTRESLAYLCMHNQQQAAQNVVNLMAWRYGNTLDTLMSKLPTKTFKTDDEYTWYIQGPSRKNWPLREARTLDGTTITSSTTGPVGANQEPIYLVFDNDWVHRGATIVGELNEVYQFVVMDEPRYEGSNTVYRVYLSGANTTGIPVERLLPGEKFSFEANFVENGLDREVGDLQGATHAQMRNEFSTIRSKYKVDGAMCYDKMAVGLQVEKDGKMVTYDGWMLYVDFLFERDFRDQKNRALAYGKSNRNENGEYMDFGPSGKAIRKSAGLYQQLDYGNVRYVNQFNLRVLEQSLMDLMSGKVDYANRHVTITTGDGGAMDFHKAILNETQGWTNLTLDNSSVNMVQKVSSPYHQNSLSAGFQFTQWRSPMGIVIDLLVDQSYNDPVRNKIRLDDGSLAYSHRMDIMDLGSGTEQNIFKCTTEAYPEVRGYQAGPFGNPFTGEMGNNHASYDENSAVVHKRAVLGMCVLDPTRVVSIIPDVLRG